MQGWDLDRVEHRAARWPRGIAHVAVPVLAGAADADRTIVLGDIGDDDDFGAARHTPALAEDVEFDFAEPPREGDLLAWREVLVAKEDHAVSVEGILDRAKGGVVERGGQIDALDFRAKR